MSPPRPNGLCGDNKVPWCFCSHARPLGLLPLALSCCSSVWEQAFVPESESCAQFWGIWSWCRLGLKAMQLLGCLVREQGTAAIPCWEGCVIQGMLVTTHSVNGKAQLFFLPHPVVEAETLLCCWENTSVNTRQCCGPQHLNPQQV